MTAPPLASAAVRRQVLVGAVVAELPGRAVGGRGVDHDRHVEVDVPAAARRLAPADPDLGFGRVVASATEVPNLLANMARSG